MRLPRASAHSADSAVARERALHLRLPEVELLIQRGVARQQTEIARQSIKTRACVVFVQVNDERREHHAAFVSRLSRDKPEDMPHRGAIKIATEVELSVADSTSDRRIHLRIGREPLQLRALNQEESGGAGPLGPFCIRPAVLHMSYRTGSRPAINLRLFGPQCRQIDNELPRADAFTRLRASPCATGRRQRAGPPRLRRLARALCVDARRLRLHLHMRTVGADAQIAYWRMFTARATTITARLNDIADCASISIFAHRLSGIVSVGLNAAAFVNET
jgi:hypothetical protein